jgi:protocatechuate 3,4-dioxygenase alpha subunit
MIPTGEATVGPFFPPVERGTNDLTVLDGRKAKGEAIEISGRVIQEDGRALEHVVVEIWQADAAGIYRHPADPRHAQADPGFLGWGRAATDAQGRYRFRTIRPGAPQGRAAHVNFMVMYSGLMRILKTTMFFEDARDPVLMAVPPERRKLLLAKGSYEFDIRLRGENETPFFDD